MDIKRMKNYLHWLYWQFKLITLSYLMDPFEWWTFHTILLVTSTITIYWVWVFIDHQIHLALELILYLLGMHSESPVSTMV